MAIITGRVILSLFAGVWIGATLIMGNNPLTGFLHIINKFVQPAVADSDHAAIIIFSMMLGGQVATWLLNVVMFFNDYANTLIVGNTMRPIADKLKISREKLSFIMDSTAAPITCITLSTWIGYKIGLIQDAFPQTGLTGGAFSVF